ncbi:uncharacterized protein JN550_004316 [Neoarthrinium moseri]|uniref:uncharacterized protein n=1 Tax=Neoarthrinium moseri TaxID=1658444 RepID=UPI001FDD4A51|nr:uncharacterized protein JN550_004316 [Neoarthrinium moseri]KAI1872113.1 hypothetical protein JN550_004316 [Neoarthrinium moseri]
MSSAALQSAPHQPTSLPPLDSHISSQYTSNRSPSREAYYARESQAAASPASSNGPSRRSRNTATHHDPGQSSTMASRTALASPVPVATGDQTPSTSSSSRRRNEQPVPPPRTSSSQQGGSSSRRSARAEERAANSPRRAATGESSSSRPVANGYEDSGSRRRAAQQESSNRGSSRDRQSTTTMPIRTNTNTSSKQPSREASEVLNRVIVSQPEDDLEREQERLDEAQPHQVTPGQTSHDYDDSIPPPIASAREAHDDGRTRRSRHDHSKREKASKFGDYYLGHTIGEGEFGKVKLGWKQDGGVQVAIKLIRRDSVGNNPSRLAKIYREVSILRGVAHPNIVRLHEMTETERHIGIVLEYASGGELFDYILTHRYLKDNAARRLFAQLISGVGYLHKKGIVHRDLKLENLLLDRNRNIIITDFGFANTFDPHDELSVEQELGLGDRDFVKRTGLDKKKSNGLRRGDLMQTSCGSPCYAAPELVVSDSLYTGRKVDVWSCGVILYAMLAGYLPFDDDPANPEGDNINLLYKYIVNTPLTFPEYVTPHARDLLRRILVPSPRKRADLFEVARHSWLSEYAHVVELITSTTTTSSEIQNTTVPANDEEPSGLARSASVREPSKSKQTAAAMGDLARKQGTVDPDEPPAQGKQQKDNKRRTVQVEYVAPTTQTQRGGEAASQASPRGKTRARSSSRGPVEVQTSPNDKPLPRDPPVTKDAYNPSPSHRTRPPSSHKNTNTHSARAGRDGSRATSEQYMTTISGANVPRPATGGSMQSTGSRHGLGAGATRASYGQPIPPTVAGTNAQGRMSQPSSGAKNYVISNPIPQEQPDLDFGRPSISAVPAKFAQVSGFSNTPPQSSGGESKGHKRSNTIGEISDKIFGRRGSIFGGRKKRDSQQPLEKANRKYPPVSMSNTMSGEPVGRPSMDSRASRRSFSQTLGLSKKQSGSMTGSQASQERPPNTRRFSLMKAIGLGREADSPPPDMSSSQHLPMQDAPQTDDFSQYAERPRSRGDHLQYADAAYDDELQTSGAVPQPSATNPARHQRYAPGSRPNAIPAYMQQGAVLNSGSESSIDHPRRKPVHNAAPYQGGYDSDGRAASRGRLQKNKRFVDAYDGEDYGRPNDHAGSSGAAKRVMDFFRRRGKARGGEA